MMNMKNEREQNKSATPSVHTNKSTTKTPQWQVVLDELIESGEDGITSWDMIVKHHITRTAAHICTLKKMGYEIFSALEYHDGKNYSRYWMEVEEDDDEDEDSEDWYDAYAESEAIFEATGRWVIPEQLRAQAEYDAYGEWKNTRGW